MKRQAAALSAKTLGPNSSTLPVRLIPISATTTLMVSRVPTRHNLRAKDKAGTDVQRNQAAWPSVIDDFVEWAKEHKAGANGMDTS